MAAAAVDGMHARDGFAVARCGVMDTRLFAEAYTALPFADAPVGLLGEGEGCEEEEEEGGGGGDLHVWKGIGGL